MKMGQYEIELLGALRPVIAALDVLGVLKVQAGGLDRAYLRDWAARLHLTDLLAQALDEAGLD